MTGSGSMPDFPTSTITFLLTDIEDSSRLWEADSEAMSLAVARHDTLAAAVIAAFQGELVRSRSEGDSLFAVFARATDALAAAAALQQALGTERWPTQSPIRVRMGIHSGEI